jgi:hypothetical protein
MALNDQTQTSIAFKKLISRDYRDTSLQWYEETPGGGFNVHSSDIWADEIPQAPPVATTPVVKCYIPGSAGSLKLTLDPAVSNNRGWEAKELGQRLRGWIPPKYGQFYTVRLYEDDGTGTARGNQIFTTDAMDWFFDCETGYLAVQDEHSYKVPFWIEGYLYVGRKGGGTASGTSISYAVTQINHGFSFGDILSRRTGAYEKALGDTLTNAEVYGIVSQVISLDQFIITVWGQISGLPGVVDDEVYFLAGDIPGGYHNYPAFVDKPVLLGLSDGSAIFINMRGIVHGPDAQSGYSGYSGISGFSGWSGYSGISGFSGWSGSQGASGFSGYAGPSGISGYSGWSGQQGQMGLSGYSGFSGISGFSGDQGFSGYSGASGWSGSQGISGYSGHSGIDGASGISGYSGRDGVSGQSGFSGWSGWSGVSGYSGQDGATGISGYSGWSGQPGNDGISGHSGFSGMSGYSGISVESKGWRRVFMLMGV